MARRHAARLVEQHAGLREQGVEHVVPLPPPVVAERRESLPQRGGVVLLARPQAGCIEPRFGRGVRPPVSSCSVRGRRRRDERGGEQGGGEAAGAGHVRRAGEGWGAGAKYVYPPGAPGCASVTTESNSPGHRVRRTKKGPGGRALLRSACDRPACVIECLGSCVLRRDNRDHPSVILDAMLARKFVSAACALIALAAPAHAAIVLDPYLAGPAATGDGLSATWSQIADDHRFSAQPWGGAPIGSYEWGSGVWGVRDVATVQAMQPGIDDALVARYTGVSAVNFANDLYNATVSSGSYGTWAQDYLRPLAPIVGLTGQQTNYVASFSGYLHVAQAGLYDLGMLVDDGFSLVLGGSAGSVAIGKETHAGSPNGREHVTLGDATGDLLELGVGYYEIAIEYYNRLEAGVIDLTWWSSSLGGWSSIGAEHLFATLPPVTSPPLPVPEPGTLALLGAGLGLLATRRPRTDAGRAAAAQPSAL